MEVKTASGIDTINKKSHYGKFLLGYISTPAWTGVRTLEVAWEFARTYKTPSISWRDLGVMVGKMMTDQKLKLQ